MAENSIESVFIITLIAFPACELNNSKVNGRNPSAAKQLLYSLAFSCETQQEVSAVHWHGRASVRAFKIRTHSLSPDKRDGDG